MATLSTIPNRMIFLAIIPIAMPQEVKTEEPVEEEATRGIMCTGEARSKEVWGVSRGIVTTATMRTLVTQTM